MKIYLDMCCFNRPYDDQTQVAVSLETQAKLHIQQMIKEKKLDLVSSYMLRYECSQNPFEMRRAAIIEFIDENAAIYVSIERQREIERQAADIMKTGVKFKDACHVSSALFAHCEYFISTDKRLLKYPTTAIKLVNPIEFIMEMEEKNNDSQYD